MENLISAIDDYLKETGMAPGTFGAYAVGDGKFVKRIKAGAQCLPRTEARVRSFIAANPPKSPKPQKQVSQ